jgi:23S rRNA (cytosine1962-C5)-methyltransferase
MKAIRLKPGKERSLQRRHPWIFDSAIARGGADPGETVRVESSEGQFLAWGAFSPTSRIRVRAWSFDEQQRIDVAFFAQACTRAIRARQRMDVASDGLRLIHGESDGLPGLIVDRYGDTLVRPVAASRRGAMEGVIADACCRTPACPPVRAQRRQQPHPGGPGPPPAGCAGPRGQAHGADDPGA